MNEADSHPFQKALSQYVRLSITTLISINISTQTLILLSSRIKKHHCRYIVLKYVLTLLEQQKGLFFWSCQQNEWNRKDVTLYMFL